MAVYFAFTFPGVANDEVSDNERAASMAKAQTIENMVLETFPWYRLYTTRRRQSILHIYVYCQFLATKAILVVLSSDPFCRRVNLAV